MRIFKAVLNLLVVFLSVTLWSCFALGQSLSHSQGPYTPPRAAEALSIELVASDDGEVVAVRVSECQSCSARTFLPMKDMTIRIGSKQVDTEQALTVNGRGGAVLYDRETEMAKVVIFFKQ